MRTGSSRSSAGDDAEVGSAGKGEDYTYYAPAHSDYLIHWTGLEFDTDYDPDWFGKHTSTTDSNVTRRYLERLRDILKHGLWMTDDKESISMNGRSYSRPKHCRTCFTELKLSAVRGHARRYGRLGIGFKRFFLFERLGGPMTYYHDHERLANWFMPALWVDSPSSYSEFFACFLKPMSQVTPDTTMAYTLYDESEWRIIYSDEIAQRLERCGKTDELQRFVPQSRFDPELQRLVQESSHPARAVIPVRSPWLAMIIYPSLVTKVAAEANSEIRQLINAIKPAGQLRNTFDKCNPADLEPYSKPIEVDLDACRHF